MKFMKPKKLKKSARPAWLTIFILLLMFAGQTRAEVDLCAKPVPTQEGLVQGKLDSGVCVWKGIPYAAPPVGELRFRATQMALPHSGVLNAYEFGPACTQKPSMFSGGESPSYSEDCLTLNIWSPQKPGKFPVMVWIHGGAFMLGAGSYNMYLGGNLSAKQDVVVVTLNYRLGTLGFLSLPELAKESPNKAAGNYGFLDQIQALKWVQQNIAAFNGDPGNVTIFGQSAGGMSVCTLMASPLAKGLFQRAIPMSGSCELVVSKEKGFEQGRLTVEKLGCGKGDVAACLRKKPVDSFLPKSVIIEFISGFGGDKGLGQVIDGYVLTESPIDSIRKGNYNKTPVMIGTTRDEMRLFTMFIPGMSHLPKWAVNKLLPKFGASSGDVFKYYSYADYQKPVDLLNRVLSDVFIAQSFNAAEALSKTTDVYFYRFDWDKTVDPAKYGAFHGLDIPFVFGNRNPQSKVSQKVKKMGDNPGQDELSEVMMRYYADFAKTGNPNGPGLPAWPKYTVEQKERIYFNNQITVAPISEKDVERCKFFNEKRRNDQASGKK